MGDISKGGGELKAIHVMSTSPFFIKNPHSEFFVEDFDLWNTALSAIMWRKLNGEIKLVTDSFGFEYYKKIGILGLWNETNNTLGDNITGIDPLIFWAGGKLFALQREEAPCAIIDTDLIIWKKISFSDKIIGAHFEDLNPDIYPDFEYFNLKDYPKLDFDNKALPINTAFLYIPDESFKQYYTSQAISFMRSTEKTNDRLCYMVFAEQRMLAMCAKKLGYKIETLLDKDSLFVPQSGVTHLWGAKQAMRENSEERKKFCEKCKNRILTEFPEYSFIAQKITDEGLRRV